MNRRLILALVPLLSSAVAAFGLTRAIDEPARGELASLNEDRRPAPGGTESPVPGRFVQQEEQQEQEAMSVPGPSISEEASPIEEIAVESRDGHKAQAVLRKPPGKGPFPALIYLHGGLVTRPITRLKEEYLKAPTLSRFLEAGYVVASAVLRSRREDPQTPVVLWDCIAIIEHIRRMTDVDPKSVVVYGTSGGGSLALELAGEIELAAIAVEEPATVLFTGLFTKDVVKDRPLGETIMNEPKRFYTPEVQRHTRGKIQKIASPIFIAHGDRHAINRINNEVFIPELKAAGKTVKVVLYPGSPHGFSMGRRGSSDAAKKFFADTHAFFTRYLATKPASWSARRETPREQREDIVAILAASVFSGLRDWWTHLSPSGGQRRPAARPGAPSASRRTGPALAR